MRTAILILICAAFLFGCNEKSKLFNLDSLPTASGGHATGDTSYIQLKPVWNGFDKPGAIKIGFDYILYVTEPDSNRIQMVDLAGNRLGHSRYVKHPIGIAEDRRFNLIIACEYDTVIGTQIVTVAAIAKIRLFEYQHVISDAPVEIVAHESPRNQIVRDASGGLISGRIYTGVAVLPDNSYYVTRYGNDNSSPVDPDNKVLHFDKNDDEYSSDYIDLVPNLTAGGGTGFVVINQVSSITTFNTKQYGSDFIITQVDPQSSYKVKWFSFDPGNELRAPEWQSRLSLDPSTYASDQLPAILTNIFVSPMAVMVDDRSNIYVVDSRLDSLMKFDQNGNLSHESFGPVKAPGELLQPSGLTYYNKIVYISDTGHDRILRYELSTDFR